MTRSSGLTRPDFRVIQGGRAHDADLGLAARVLAGERAASAEVYDRLAPRMNAALARILGHHFPELDDALQSAFVELVVSLRRYRGECSLATWASRVAANVGLNTLRSRRRRRAVFSEEEAPEASARGPDPLLVRRLRAALLELSEEKAEALVMADVLGHDIAEIAILTGATVSATQSRVARARAELRSLLEAP